MVAMLFIVYNTFEFKVFVASILVGPFAPSIQEIKTYFVVLGTAGSRASKSAIEKRARLLTETPSS